jgi:hypothetical protein
VAAVIAAGRAAATALFHHGREKPGCGQNLARADGQTVFFRKIRQDHKAFAARSQRG